MLLDMREYLSGDFGVGVDVAAIRLPVAHFPYLEVLGRHDADGDLCRSARVRTVKGDRRDGPSAHALLGFLAEAFD
jgi:hypothetical protein